ncbi:16555_t:CDS:2 [Cetraspora pellucida]|uniref:16555_t:CDS:1 n=1 Tax=Cetraspora pellucida TaxID=1433469 RepID=A0A9N9FPD2_9GLOM|nr:16555_t:CDS:2 [Cetraspora pellucida]
MIDENSEQPGFAPGHSVCGVTQKQLLLDDRALEYCYTRTISYTNEITVDDSKRMSRVRLV